MLLKIFDIIENLHNSFYFENIRIYVCYFYLLAISVVLVGLIWEYGDGIIETDT